MLDHGTAVPPVCAATVSERGAAIPRARTAGARRCGGPLNRSIVLR